MDSSILKNINLFSELDENEMDKIYSHSSIKTYDKGEMIFFDTEPYIGFYIVIEGGVKIFKISKDGREHVIHFIFPTNTFAEAPLFEHYDKIRREEFTYPAVIRNSHPIKKASPPTGVIKAIKVIEVTEYEYNEKEKSNIPIEKKNPLL